MQFSDSVLLVITVPKTHGDQIRQALGNAGAGRIGDYAYCSHTTEGVGRFLPQKGASPSTGSIGTLEEVLEERIETLCQENIVDFVLEEVYKVHPYEEPVVYIYPLYQTLRKKCYDKS